MLFLSQTVHPRAKAQGDYMITVPGSTDMYIVDLKEDYIVLEIGGPCPHCSLSAQKLEKVMSQGKVVFLAGTCETTTMWNGRNRNHIWFNGGNPPESLTFPSTFSEFKILYLKRIESKGHTLTDGQRKIIEEEAGKILLGQS